MARRNRPSAAATGARPPATSSSGFPGSADMTQYGHGHPAPPSCPAASSRGTGSPAPPSSRSAAVSISNEPIASSLTGW